MSLDIHQNIVHKLNTFKKTNRIPNIIFHGPSGGGKHTLVNTFINDIYNHDKDRLNCLENYKNCNGSEIFYGFPLMTRNPQNFLNYLRDKRFENNKEYLSFKRIRRSIKRKSNSFQSASKIN